MRKTVLAMTAVIGMAMFTPQEASACIFRSQCSPPTEYLGALNLDSDKIQNIVESLGQYFTNFTKKNPDFWANYKPPVWVNKLPPKIDKLPPTKVVSEPGGLLLLASGLLGLGYVARTRRGTELLED